MPRVMSKAEHINMSRQLGIDLRAAVDLIKNHSYKVR